MPPILITRDFGAASGGSSGVRIMADAEEQKYYVKFRENAQFLKVLVNEYVAGKIAEALLLPAPQIHIVNIAPLLAPTLAPINQLAISQGPHFGSRELQNLYGLPPIRNIIGRCYNQQQYPAIILFDALLYNSDRRNDGNFIITTSEQGLRFNIIDHGFCFGQQWDIAILGQIRNEWSDAYLPEMYDTITDRAEFDNALVQITNLTDQFFINLVAEVPAEWLPDFPERQALTDFLLYQRDHIGEMLAANLHKFHNLIQHG